MFCRVTDLNWFPFLHPDRKYAHVCNLFMSGHISSEEEAGYSEVLQGILSSMFIQLCTRSTHNPSLQFLEMLNEEYVSIWIYSGMYFSSGVQLHLNKDSNAPHPAWEVFHLLLRPTILCSFSHIEK